MASQGDGQQPSAFWPHIADGATPIEEVVRGDAPRHRLRTPRERFTSGTLARQNSRTSVPMKAATVM